MPRQKSAMKSGISNAARVFTRLIEAVEDLGGGDDDIRRIETDADLRQELAKLIIGEPADGSSDTYTVTVGYGQLLDQMIAAGQYNWVNSEITDRHFPIQGSGSSEVEIVLVHFGRNMNTDDVLQDLDRRGYRPAKVEELLALGADPKTRDLQRQFPIIALGSVGRYPLGDPVVACLNRHDAERRLGIDWYGGGWSDLCRFAAVRK